jgi:hypothetical protein
MFTRATLAGEPIEVFNRGAMERYIDDVVEAVVRVVDRVPKPTVERLCLGRWRSRRRSRNQLAKGYALDIPCPAAR